MNESAEERDGVNHEGETGETVRNLVLIAAALLFVVAFAASVYNAFT